MNPISVSKKLARMGSLLYHHPSELQYLHRWLYSKRPGNTPLTEERPWVTYRALDWIDNFLDADMSVFEYGAGGSTIFFAKRAREVVSVEHDSDYFALVQSILNEKGLSNATLMLRRPMWDCVNPSTFRSSQVKYKGADFETYVRAIDEYPDGSFDLVMVDGRARVASVRQSLPKLKAGGALVLDNSNRPPYAEALELLSSYPAMHFSGVSSWNMDVTTTSVWRISN